MVGHRDPDVIVIGSGHNGLTAACYLARAGAEVLVVEAGTRIGGMTATNPTIAAAPTHLINEGAMDVSTMRATSIAEELDLGSVGFRQVEVDPSYVFLDPEGASLAIWRDPRRTVEEIKRFSAADARAYLDLARTLDGALDAILPYMTAHPTRPGAQVVGRMMAGAARHPRQVAAFTRLFTMSHAEVIAERFTHPMVRGVLAAIPCFSQITGDGSGWNLINFAFVHRFGIGRIVGGTGALPLALTRRLESYGGRVITGAGVEQILVRDGRACGVRLVDGRELSARAVLSACNVKTTLSELVPAEAMDRALVERARHIPTRSTHATSLKVDVAVSGRIDLPRHHAWRGDGVDLRKPCAVWVTFEEHIAAWEACARGVVPDPLPTTSIIPTAADPTQAPHGQDTFWIWSGIAPTDPHVPWTEMGERVGNAAVKAATTYYTGIEELEIGRRVTTSPQIAERFNAPDGNVYHVDVSSLRFGSMRPGRGFGGYTTPVANLFITGAGTHPVAGVCAVPGRLAAAQVQRTLGSGTGSRARTRG